MHHTARTPSFQPTLPIADGEVDFVFSKMFLHHVEDPAAALREMAHVLAPGGRLVLSDLDALITYHPGDQSPTLELLDEQGQTLAGADEAKGRRMRLAGLEPGDYAYRVRGPLTRSIDFVVESRQQ